MFNTQYRTPSRFSAAPGSPEKTIFKSRYAKDGSIEIVEAGIDNLYEYIQSHAQSVDINVILQRYANGDVSALSRSQGMYGDFTGMPDSFVGVLNMINDTRDYFDGLPLDVKAKFGHSFDRFVASLDNPSVYADLFGESAKEPVSPVVDKEVVTDVES